jgi:hypothetical protein
VVIHSILKEKTWWTTHHSFGQMTRNLSVIFFDHQDGFDDQNIMVKLSGSKNLFFNHFSSKNMKKKQLINLYDSIYNKKNTF